jgi:SAM-dependent methyltransferase
LRAHFENHDPASHGQKWDELWRENFAPWDNGLPNPAFVDILNEREDLSYKKADGSRKKALVAGCGKGYDVLLLSAMGYDAYGLEISDTALQASKKFANENDGKGAYATKEGVEKGRVTWLAGDFFKDEFLKEVEGEKKFDLFYDYTVCFHRICKCQGY